MEKYYKIAELYCKILGDGPFFHTLASYFSEKEISGSGSNGVDIVIRVFEEEKECSWFSPDFYSLSGSIAFNHKVFYVKRPPFSYSVKNLFTQGEVTEVCIYPRWTSKGSLLGRLINKVGSFKAGMYVGKHDIYENFVQYITNYGCLWYIFAIELMKKDCVFLHCGMMAKDGQGKILTGTSGCGKTSTMLEMITHSGYKYMAEDFGILSKEGIMYDMPKKAAIYQSDVKWGNPYLSKAIESLSRSERCEWKFKTRRHINARHNFKPSEIFGKDIACHAKLDSIFVLQRTLKGNSIECRDINFEELAERAKTASFREIKELYEILCNIRAVGGKAYYADYPSVYELEQQYLDIIKPALKGASCYEISVPVDVNPQDTAKEILKY